MAWNTSVKRFVRKYVGGVSLVCLEVNKRYDEEKGADLDHAQDAGHGTARTLYAFAQSLLHHRQVGLCAPETGRESEHIHLGAPSERPTIQWR